jgi:hypothetical protein
MDIFMFSATSLQIAYGQFTAGRIARARLRDTAFPVKQLRSRKLLGLLFNLYQFHINNEAK